MPNTVRMENDVHVWMDVSQLPPPPPPHTHTQSCVRCILRTSYCSPLLFPLLLDLNFFRHLPLDVYTFFNRGHLLTITANRGPIAPLCYKSSVYPLDTLTRTYTCSVIVGTYIMYITPATGDQRCCWVRQTGVPITLVSSSLGREMSPQLVEGQGKRFSTIPSNMSVIAQYDWLF